MNADRLLQIYFIFIGIDALCLWLTWLYFPEFQYLSLEEIDHVFETPGVHPVKISKAVHRATHKARREARKAEKAQNA